MTIPANVLSGPYAPAILRFQITFPYDYPDLPPTITFITDIFHPLVTPLTTYTYTTGSLSSDTVSATDEERLPPGSFSLRHGFPHWFGRAHKSLGSSATSSRDVSGSYTINSHIKEAPIALPAAVGPSHEISARLLIPLQGSGCIKQQKQCSNLSIINRVLEYMKYSFDDEMFLDRVPISAAGNAGAWRAWRAHRANSGVVVEDRVAGEWSPDDGDDWKWDGVWEQRVRRGVDTSTSDSVLFGGTGGGDDLVCSKPLNLDSN